MGRVLKGEYISRIFTKGEPTLWPFRGQYGLFNKGIVTSRLIDFRLNTRGLPAAPLAVELCQRTSDSLAATLSPPNFESHCFQEKHFFAELSLFVSMLENQTSSTPGEGPQIQKTTAKGTARPGFSAMPF